ncbi:MAG: hypothetical protein DMF99_13055 [Acidobacteria bacterium]|nr:MAG: hypothetical protein DMF99_13055 [Acidobacteriota bacterium]
MDGEQYTFRVGARVAIAGLEYGVEGMRVGGRRRIRVPPHLAYREEGVAGKVPPTRSCSSTWNCSKSEVSGFAPADGRHCTRRAARPRMGDSHMVRHRSRLSGRTSRQCHEATDANHGARSADLATRQRSGSRNHFLGNSSDRRGDRRYRDLRPLDREQFRRHPGAPRNRGNLAFATVGVGFSNTRVEQFTDVAVRDILPGEEIHQIVWSSRGSRHTSALPCSLRPSTRRSRSGASDHFNVFAVGWHGTAEHGPTICCLGMSGNVVHFQSGCEFCAWQVARVLVTDAPADDGNARILGDS